jgi:predicted regulator of Ras-like GTPase activity (Roadblock/LC7/MglB family)
MNELDGRTHATRAARNLNWLLANLVSEVPGTHRVVVVSSDGLLLAVSEARHGGRHRSGPGGSAGRAGMALATVVAGLVSLADGAARLLEQGGLRQTVVAMDRGHLFLMSISDGSHLGVHAGPECDMTVVGYQMTLFVERAGHVLTPELRGELREAMADQR